MPNSVDEKNEKNEGKASWKDRNGPSDDPALLHLLEAAGLVEQLSALRSLGVAKPSHISDLLVEDLEEVGLSRVQIRQLQRALTEPHDSSPSHSPLRSNERSEAAPLLQDVSPTLKESRHPCNVDRHDLPGRNGCTAGVLRQMTEMQKAVEEPPLERLTDVVDDHRGAHRPEEKDPSAARTSGAPPPYDKRFGAEQLSPGDSVVTLGSKARAGGPHFTRPPLYKQTPSVRVTSDHGPTDAKTSSGQGAISNPWTECPQAVSAVQPCSAQLEQESPEALRAEDLSDSSLDFDVTLLPELPELQNPEVPRVLHQDETTPLLMKRQDSFGAGPQPNVDAPTPSAQLPAALRQRLEAREEVRKAQRSRDATEAQPRVRSPPRREPRSMSERPCMNRTSSGPRAASLGAASRQMFSKNELRAANRAPFLNAIEKYQAKIVEALAGIPTASPGDKFHSGCRPVQVYVRKRPLFPHEEAKRNDFDVVSILSGSPPTQMVLHNCLFQADLRTPVVHHVRFAFDHVFGDEVSDEEVYRASASNLVESTKEGRANTILMFGQTGSGKTHTMKAIEHLCAKDLFQSGCQMSLTFVELRGSRCFDLLLPHLPEVRLREQKKGDRKEESSAFVPDGAHELQVESPEALLAIFQAARHRRATSATEANDESSRSHAICTLRLGRSCSQSFATGRSGGCGGSLTLVDCAGTERRKDSANHTRERQQEGAEINASLHALKECIRFMSKGHRIPSHAFRASALTKLLATSLSSADTRLSVICTVAPAASDTEHTLSTLRTGMTLRVKAPEQDVEKEVLPNITKQRDPHPRQWSPQQVQAWLRQLEDGLFADVCSTLPAEFTGQMLVRLSEGHCVQLCGSESRGRLLFDLLHQAMRGSDSTRR